MESEKLKEEVERHREMPAKTLNTSLRRSNRRKEPPKRIRESIPTEEMIKKRKTGIKTVSNIYKMGCECDDPYDETKPMLECETCSGWFHGDCVDFTCASCTKRDISNHKSGVNPEEDKNDEKEKKAEEESKKNKQLREKLEQQVAKKNLENKNLREERDELKSEKRELEKTVKNQKVEISRLEKDNAEEKKKVGKTSSSLSALEKQMKEHEDEHQKTEESLKKELNNRETEIDMYESLNRRLKERLYAVGNINDLTDDSDNIMKEKNLTINATTQCDITFPGNMRVEEDEENQGAPEEQNNMKKIRELEEKVRKLEESETEKEKEKEKDAATKAREIKHLKEQVTGYQNRLENTLGNISAKEKEVIHLTESLATLKNVNMNLVLQLEEKNQQQEWEEYDKNFDDNDKLFEPIEDSDDDMVEGEELERKDRNKRKK